MFTDSPNGDFPSRPRSSGPSRCRHGAITNPARPRSQRRPTCRAKTRSPLARRLNKRSVPAHQAHATQIATPALSSSSPSDRHIHYLASAAGDSSRGREASRNLSLRKEARIMPAGCVGGERDGGAATRGVHPRYVPERGQVLRDVLGAFFGCFRPAKTRPLPSR
jgi:hypothetical protein